MFILQTYWSRSPIKSYYKSYIWPCLSLFLGWWLLVGCSSPGYIDETKHIASEKLNVPSAQYRSVAWLEDKELALSYKEPGEREGKTRVALYSLDSQELKDIILPNHSDHCFPVPSGIGFLQRLPNDKLGYAYFCKEVTGGQSGILYTWDGASGQSQILQEYSDFSISSYTLAPDMSEVIQENAVGVGLNNELYRFQLGGEGKQIFGHFQRAARPSWSSDGKTIIFAGTESTPYDSPTTSRDIKNLLFYPWTIYAMDVDGNQVREMLTGISYPGTLSWSPDGRWIAFSATYQNKRGIWLLEVDTETIRLISERYGTFDWSPNSKQLVVLEHEDNGDPLNYFTYPTILTLP